MGHSAACGIPACFAPLGGEHHEPATTQAQTDTDDGTHAQPTTGPARQIRQQITYLPAYPVQGIYLLQDLQRGFVFPHGREHITIALSMAK